MERPIVIGLDIGGSKIAAAVVDAFGRILARASIPTAAEGGFTDGLKRIGELLEQLFGQTGAVDRLAAIGIGCAGPLDPLRGTIDNPYTLPTWDGVNIVRPLGERYGVPVALENDADAAAMGECWLGAGRGGELVAMVTVGTGVGGGVIARGRIYRGVGGAHPEIGHQCIDPAGPPCYCGIRGCWESLASGTAMALAAEARIPGFRAGEGGAKEVVTRARAGDPLATDIVARAARVTALGVFNLANLYMPEIIVLGGGVMEAFDLFEPAIRQVLDQDTMAPVERIRFCKAQLGGDAGILGAARIALDRMGGDRPLDLGGG